MGRTLWPYVGDVTSTPPPRCAVHWYRMSASHAEAPFNVSDWVEPLGRCMEDLRIATASARVAAEASPAAPPSLSAPEPPSLQLPVTIEPAVNPVDTPVTQQTCTQVAPAGHTAPLTTLPVGETASMPPGAGMGVDTELACWDGRPAHAHNTLCHTQALSRTLP